MVQRLSDSIVIEMISIIKFYDRLCKKVHVKKNTTEKITDKSYLSHFLMRSLSVSFVFPLSLCEV